MEATATHSETVAPVNSGAELKSQVGVSGDEALRTGMRLLYCGAGELEPVPVTVYAVERVGYGTEWVDTLRRPVRLGETHFRTPDAAWAALEQNTEDAIREKRADVAELSGKLDAIRRRRAGG